MKWSLLFLWCVLLVAAGCQRSAPQWNTLSPFGATRVPPPATGGYGQPNSYYQSPIIPPGAPSIEVGKKPGAASLGINSSGGWSAPGQGQAVTVGGSTGFNSSEPQATVAAVTHTQPVDDSNYYTTSSTSGVRIRPPSGGSSSVRSGGMAVTDLTGANEPAAFQPPPDLIELRGQTSDEPIGSGLKWRTP